MDPKFRFIMEDLEQVNCHEKATSSSLPGLVSPCQSSKVQNPPSMPQSQFQTMQQPEQEQPSQTQQHALSQSVDGRELEVWESSLEDRANCWQHWMLSYLNPLLALGSRKILTADDVGVPSSQDCTHLAYETTLDQWQRQVQLCQKINDRKKLKEGLQQTPRNKRPILVEPSMGKALLFGFGVTKVIRALVYYLLAALLQFVPVLILQDLVKFFESGETVHVYYKGRLNPWMEVVGLAVVPCVSTILETQHNVIFAHARVWVRSAVSMLLYQKSLHISPLGKLATSTGQVVNMMSNDTNQMQKFLEVAGMCLVAPIQIVLAVILIYKQVQKELPTKRQCMYLTLLYGSSLRFLFFSDRLEMLHG